MKKKWYLWATAQQRIRNVEIKKSIVEKDKWGTCWRVSSDILLSSLRSKDPSNLGPMENASSNLPLCGDTRLRRRTSHSGSWRIRLRVLIFSWTSDWDKNNIISHSLDLTTAFGPLFSSKHAQRSITPMAVRNHLFVSLFSTFLRGRHWILDSLSTSNLENYVSVFLWHGLFFTPTERTRRISHTFRDSLPSM